MLAFIKFGLLVKFLLKFVSFAIGFARFLTFRLFSDSRKVVFVKHLLVLYRSAGNLVSLCACMCFVCISSALVGIAECRRCLASYVKYVRFS